MTSKKIQQRINGELTRLGWSRADFVKEYDKHLKYKSNLTVESFKKQLSRESTKLKLLENYLYFIESHEQWLKLGEIRPIFTSSEEFSHEFNKRMVGVSKMLTDKMKNDL